MSKPNVSYSEPLRQSVFVVVLKICLLQLLVGLMGILTVITLGWLIESRGLLTSLLGIASIIYQTLDAVILVTLILQWLHTSYIITPDEIIINRGIFNVQTTRYKTDSIVEVKVKQSFLGKLFNYGTLVFHDPSYDQDVIIVDIPQPHRWSEIIRQIKSGG